MTRFSARLYGFRSAPRPIRRTDRRRLAVEPLEDRTVPATYWVNTTGDTVDSDPNVTSLREAIETANGTSVADEIRFTPRAYGTIALDETLGQLEVTSDLKILGPGADLVAVSGDDAVRVFYVGPDATAAIARLTITKGRAETRETVLRSHGGGVLNDGDLTLTDVVLSDNKAVGILNVADEPRHLGAGAGGGVANKGTLTVTGCTFFENQALGVDNQAGVFISKLPPDHPNPFGEVKFPGMGIGGGLWNWKTGEVTVTNSRFIDNLAQGGNNGKGTFAGLGQGGAIYNDNDLKVTGSQFTGNRAVGGSQTISDVFGGEAVGGAISSGTNERLIGDTGSAELTVSRSVFSHNEAVGGSSNLSGPQGVVAGAGGGFGGGIFVFQGEATIRGTTLADNRAAGGAGAAGKVGGLAIGGGIVFVNFLGPVTGAVEGCALLHNEAAGGAGGTGARGGNALGGGLAAGTFGTSAFSGEVTVRDSTVAGNLARGGSLGGGLFNDAGETLHVVDVVVSKNMAVGDANAIPDAAWGPGVAVGGGVYNRGTLFVSDSTFTRNQARGASGSDGLNKYNYAGVALGGGLANTGVATVTDSRFTGNLAQGGNSCKTTLLFAGVAGGGAIASTGFFAFAKLDVSDSSFTNNQAVGGNDNVSARLPGFGSGGAIFSHRFSKGAELHVRDSTFGHNLAVGGNSNQQTAAADPVFGPNFASGGGVFIAGRDTTNTISGSKFDHNQAIGGQGLAGTNGGEGHGGGIGVGFAGTIVEVADCKVEHNLAVGGQAEGGNGGDARGGGIFNEGGAVLTVTGGIVEHNQALGGNGGLAGDGLGGGLYNDAASTITVTDSTVEHNLARGGDGSTGGDGQGGGLYNTGSATVAECTIAHNKAEGGVAGPGGVAGTSKGGGVYNAGTIWIGPLTVISHNKADEFPDCFGC